jgi:hypothetical protein
VWLWFVFLCIIIFFFLHFEMWINTHTLKFSICSWKASIFFWLCATIYELMYSFNISFGACFEHFIWYFCCEHVHLQCLSYNLLPISNIYLLFSGARITTFKSTLSIVDNYSIPPQLLLIILLILPTHKKYGWEGNLLSHVWNMLVFGPTLHHPSTKHQALVKT